MVDLIEIAKPLTMLKSIGKPSVGHVLQAYYRDGLTAAPARPDTLSLGSVSISKDGRRIAYSAATRSMEAGRFDLGLFPLFCRMIY